MIGVDANILIRFFAEDDPLQFQLASAHLEQRLTGEDPGLVSITTMAETVLVLQRSFKLFP